MLVKQVDESKVRLDHKLENFENRCQRLVERIKETTLQKIELLKAKEEKVLKDVETLVGEGNTTYDDISTRLEELKTKISGNSFHNNNGKVSFVFSGVDTV